MTNFARTAVVLIGLLLALVVVTVVTHPELSAAVSALAAVTAAAISSAALGQVRRDSRNSSRPMVAASLRPAENVVGEPNELTRAVQEIVVRNYGRTIARDVIVTFKPQLPRAPGLVDLVELYSRPVPVLVPGAELTNVWAGPTAEETPEQVTATISYTDGDGVPYGPEMFLLDVRVVRSRTYVEGNRS